MSNDRKQPNKVLPVNITTRTSLAAWPYEDFPGDPYWVAGATPKPYQWIMGMTITPQIHGDPSVSSKNALMSP